MQYWLAAAAPNGSHNSGSPIAYVAIGIVVVVAIIIGVTIFRRR